MEMEPETKIITILNNICGADEGELEPGLNLFESGLLDSFGVIQLFTALEETFGISLQIETIPRERIATPLDIAALVREASA